MDTLSPAPAGLRGDPDVIARAEALRPEVEAASGEIERSRRLPPAILDKLHEARLFRLLLPRSVNGVETDPLTFFHVIEIIARADGSTAWCLSQSGGCATAAAYLDAPVADQIFGKDPRAMLAWGPGPKVKAIATDGGYRVTGAWAFASGGRHATWVGAHCPIYRPDGTPLIGPDDRQVERTMLVPSSEVVWTDIWDTIGLRGTASDQFALNDHFVRADHSITRNFEKECRESGPLYRMASSHFYQIGFAGVALGIARASLDAFVDLARHKVLRGFKSPLRDSAVVQTNLARAEVSVRAARAHLLQSVSEIWSSISQPGGKLTFDHRIMLRMASTYAIHQARDAVDFAYNVAGTAVVFASHPLERRFRDMHTVTQQIQGRLSHLETAGAWIMGAEVDLTFV